MYIYIYVHIYICIYIYTYYILMINNDGLNSHTAVVVIGDHINSGCTPRPPHVAQLDIQSGRSRRAWTINSLSL